MADDRLDPADLASHRILRAVSAALDGEETMPADADADAFRRASLRLRQAVRVQEAAVPPDVTDAVLARITGSAPSSVRRHPLAVAASIAFLAAALVASLTVAPGWRGADVLAADVDDRLLAGQRAVTAIDATVELVEQGAHPDLPVRRYAGTLRYRAPEQLWLSLTDVSARPQGWPANDLDLVVDAGRVRTTGLRACHVADQPGCLRGPMTTSMVGVPPFAADVQAPLDLVVPAGGLVALPDDAAVRTADAVVELTVPVARVQPLLDALADTGALRRVHASDQVLLRLDADDLSLRGLSVRAGSDDARASWAVANGYRDRPGDPLLDLRLTSRQRVGSPPVPSDAPQPDGDAGFVDDPAAGAVRPAQPPAGFTLHRAGHLRAGGPLTEVVAYTDGRAWLRVDATRSWEVPWLFGDLGPLVRRVELATGVGYTTPEGDVVALRAAGWDVAVTGSVPLAVLAETAASLEAIGAAGPQPLVGRPLPAAWSQADQVTVLPPGALRPDGPLTARAQPDGSILVAVPGPGGSGARLLQRPTAVLPPPPKGDVIEVPVRGVAGRWSAPLGQLSWAADGWSSHLSSRGLGLNGLLAVAERLS